MITNNFDILWIIVLGTAVMISVIILIVLTVFRTHFKINKSSLEKAQSEEKYNSLIETIDESILIVNKQLDVIFANTKFTKRWNLHKSDVVGKPLSKIFADKLITNKIRSIFKTGNSERFDFNIELSENIAWFNIVITPQYDIGSQLTNAMCIFKDRSQNRDLSDKSSAAIDSANLSKREVEILQQIASGKTSKEIGKELFISWKTVEKHRSNIMKKLDIHNVAGLTRFAIENKLLQS